MIEPDWREYDYEEIRWYAEDVQSAIKGINLRLSRLPTCLVASSPLYQELIQMKKHYSEVSERRRELGIEGREKLLEETRRQQDLHLGML